MEELIIKINSLDQTWIDSEIEKEFNFNFTELNLKEDETNSEN
jgi:hypothetical protein